MSSTPPKKRKPLLLIRRVVGHSMLPVLPPGTLVVASGILRRNKRGSVVIILHDGKEKIKRIEDIRPGEVFVIGDNEESSTDSRQFGWLPLHSVKARVFWPRKIKS